MINNQFKIALRKLWSNRIFSLINIVGLSLGLASILSLALLVNQYFTRDAFHAYKDRLYYTVCNLHENFRIPTVQFWIIRA